ncbi:MAG: MarR family winged helix-turn-helix transcriptional regulator [Hyphomicrobiaceae bacterium]
MKQVRGNADIADRQSAGTAGCQPGGGLERERGVPAPGDVPLTVGIDALAGEGSDAGFRDFVADLFAAASAMQAVRRALGKASGLSGVDIAVLLAIQRLSVDGPVSISAIAGHLHMAGPQVTTGVGKLEAAGLATKHVTASDNRVVDVRLTALGRKRLAQLASRVRKVNDVLFAGMTAEEMLHVHAFLRRIIGNCTPSIATLEAPARRLRNSAMTS